MPLTSPRNMFDRALKEGFAVGAFNVNNMEIIQGILQAGAEEDAPVILQVSAGARKYAGQNYIVRLVEAGLMESAASGSRGRLRDLQGLRGRRLHVRHDRRLASAV